MKILMISTEKLPVPPVLGGAIQTYISGTLPYLSNVHDITLLGISDPSLPDEEIKDGIKYVRVTGKVFERYKEEVVRYVRANQFDLIHIFNRPRLVLPVRSVAPQSKITLSMHNDMFNIDKIDPIEASAVIETTSNIVTVSDYVGNVIRHLYPQASSKLRTIYSGVDSQRFLPGSHPMMQNIRNEIRRANGLENKTVILFAGRLSKNKGVDRLVRAIPALTERFNDLALVIVGSKWFSQNELTDYLAYVRALANKLPIPVVTTGFVAPGEIQNWFAAADLFVCTSLWQEPLARVHYEAMAAGLPIVTTARGGNPEVILLGENGLIVENPEDPACFAEKIAEILSDKSLMQRMGQKGRELAVEKYGWSRVASEIIEVWEQAAIQESVQYIPPYVIEQILNTNSQFSGENREKKTVGEIDQRGRSYQSKHRHRDNQNLHHEDSRKEDRKDHERGHRKEHRKEHRKDHEKEHRREHRKDHEKEHRREHHKDHEKEHHREHRKNHEKDHHKGHHKEHDKDHRKDDHHQKHQHKHGHNRKK